MFLHFVIDSFYSLSISQLLKKLHPDNRHVFIMMQHSGSSQQYSILEELRLEALAISPSDQNLYNRVSDTWLSQFDKIFIHGLYHSGLIHLVLSKISEKTLQKIYFIPYDGDVQLAVRFLREGNKNAPNVMALQKLINWVIPPGYQKVRSDFFASYDTGNCNFIELEPILLQPLQPIDIDEVEEFVKQRISLDRTLKTTNIMVGHSCSSNDNHIEALELLAPLAGENVRVILPMSYHVDLGYRQKVVNIGQSLFGKKLDVWTEYVSPSEYRKQLMEIDVAILNLYDLSGLGVITYLLMIGSKVYSRSEHLAGIQSFVDNSCHMFYLDDLRKDPKLALICMNQEHLYENFKAVSRSRYSTRKVLDNWRKLLVTE